MENGTPHVLTHKWVLNNENTWISHPGVCWGLVGQGRDSSGSGDWGGITLGEIPNIADKGMEQQTTMACVSICNNSAHSAHVSQNFIMKEIYKK